MPTHMLVPLLGESISEAILVTWWKAEGDPVKRGEEIAEVETAKANMALECPASGVLLSIVAQPGDTVRTGDLLAVIGKPGEVLAAPEAVQPAAVEAQPVASEAQPVTLEIEESAASRPLISPAARKLAAGLGVDVSAVPPAAPGRRVMTEDVQRFYDQQRAPTNGEVPGRRVVLTDMRRLTGQRMLESVRTIPQFSVTAEADVTRLLAFKAAHRQAHPHQRLTMTALLVHFTARALLQHPELNARYDDGSLWVYDTVNMAVAVDTPRGLAAPVLPGVERLPLGETARALNDLVDAARAGHLKPEQLSGGTFTLSNLGMQRVVQFTPLVNPPQAAILGAGAARPVVLPVASGGTRHAMLLALTLTADHRVVDGAGAARFLSDLCQILESEPDSTI